MNATNDITRSANELAAHWTDAVLAILKAAGIRRVSVEMEVEAWHTVEQVLQSELRWQRAFRFSTLVSLSTLMEQVLYKSAMIVAQKFEPESATAAFGDRVRRFTRDRQSTWAERRLYSEMVREPAVRAAFKPMSRTDYVPRLRVSALRG